MRELVSDDWDRPKPLAPTRSWEVERENVRFIGANPMWGVVLPPSNALAPLSVLWVLLPVPPGAGNPAGRADRRTASLTTCFLKKEKEDAHSGIQSECKSGHQADPEYAVSLSLPLSPSPSLSLPLSLSPSLLLSLLLLLLSLSVAALIEE